VANSATGDVYTVISVPANSKVLAVAAENTSLSHTGVSGVVTFSVGDGSDADGWITASSRTVLDAQYNSDPTVSASSITVTGNAAYTVSATIAPAYGLGKSYSAADTIDLTSLGIATDGVVRIKATILDLTR
jgi:hypothetical protein